jgi:hypothetical protein
MSTSRGPSAASVALLSAGVAAAGVAVMAAVMGIGWLLIR